MSDDSGRPWGAISAVAGVLGVIVAVVAIFVPLMTTKPPENPPTSVALSPVGTDVNSPTPSSSSSVPPMPGTPTPSGGDSPRPSQTATAVPNPVIYLRDESPVDRNGGAYPEPATLNHTDYNNGIQVTCSGGTYYTYPTNGKSSFKVVFGINDGAEGATGIEAILSVFDENNHELPSVATVSLGHSESRSYNVKAATQITIKCYSRDRTSHAVRPIDRIALGDARLV